MTQTFAYNPASQIGSVTRSNDLYAWTGHTNDNLSSTPNGGADFKAPASNARWNVGGGLNQIGNVGAAAITHDAKGNITAVGAQTYAYTSENLLSSASGGVTAYYDHLMRLVEYDTNVSTRFVHEGAAIAAEVDGPGAIQRRYVRGDGMDELLVDYVGTGTTARRFLSTDERGTVIATTDSNGALIGINKYDEYGVPQAGNLGRFGYTGQAWFGEVGSSYYKARWYRPDLGRFLSTDPIGYEAGMNLYAYVGNDPVNWTDPLGLFQCPDIDGSLCRSSPPPPPTDNTIWVFGFRCSIRGCRGYGIGPFWGTRPMPDLFDGDIWAEVSDMSGELIDEVADSITAALCAAPAVSGGLGADLYAVAGGSLGGGINIDLANGIFGLNGSTAVGVGYGADVGPNFGMGPSGGGVVSGNLAVNGGATLPFAPLGNLGFAGTYNLLGTSPGFSGGAIGRAGTPVGYANVGANIGFNTPSLYDLECDSN